MINGAIRRALQVAKMRKTPTQQAPSAAPQQAPLPRREDMPVDPTRSKSAQERQKFQEGGDVWDKPRPKSLGKPEHLSKKEKSSAKAAAKAAGRPYPNLIDNMRAARADGGPLPPRRPVEFAGEDASRAFPGIWKNVNPVVKYNMGRQEGYAETYPPRETGDPKNPRSTRPKEFPMERTGIEVYRPEMSGADLALELLHADPKAIETRNRLLPTMSPEQLEELRRREDYKYSIKDKLPQQKAYENAMDAAARSYLANKRDLPHSQGPASDIEYMQYTDDQKKHLDKLYDYMMSGKYAGGGSVERPTKMNDKVRHALDVALSETHPKRFHHTLAKSGYADGGVPEMQAPQDLAKEVPFTHDKALASQFDVAKAQPYKPKAISPGKLDVVMPKKAMVRGPRLDMGKMRIKKARAPKLKKFKLAHGGHPDIDDALRLASRTMSDMAKNIGDEGVHGASMQQGSTSTVVKEKVPGKKAEVVYEHHAKTPTEEQVFASGGGAWTRAEGKNPEGGLNAKGRASAKAEGMNLKPPAPHPKTDKDASRRDSFCARMSGMKAKLTSSKTANDPDSRINKSLRAWNCRADGGRLMHQDIMDALNLAQRRRHFADGGFDGGSAGPMPSRLPTGLMMPDDLNNPSTRFHKPTQEEMYGGAGSPMAMTMAPQPTPDQVSSTMLGWIMDGGGREMPRWGTHDLRPINRNELSPEQLQRFNEYKRPGYERNIDRLYQQELGRKGDQGGMDYWRQQFENGMPMDQIRQMFDQSEEGQAFNQQPPRFANDPRNPHIGPNNPFPPGTTPDVMNPQYDPYFGNQPLNDVMPNFPMTQVNPFPGATLGGGPRPPFPGDMGGSGTKAGGLGGQGPMPKRTPLEELNMMYQSELGRDADEGGRDYWLQQLNNGMSMDQIRNSFDSSQEGQAYNQRMAPMIDGPFGVGGSGTKAGGSGQPSFPLQNPGYPQNPNAPMPNIPPGGQGGMDGVFNGVGGMGNGTKAGGSGTKAGPSSPYY